MSEEKRSSSSKRSMSREKKKAKGKNVEVDLKRSKVTKSRMTRQSSNRSGYLLPSIYTLEPIRGRSNKPRSPKESHQCHEEPAKAEHPAKPLAAPSSSNDDDCCDSEVPRATSADTTPLQTQALHTAMPPTTQQGPFFENSNTTIARDDFINEKAIQSVGSKHMLTLTNPKNDDIYMQAEQKQVLVPGMEKQEFLLTPNVCPPKIADEEQASAPRHDSHDSNSHGTIKQDLRTQKRKWWIVIVVVIVLLLIIGGTVAIILSLTKTSNAANSSRTKIVNPTLSPAPTSTPSFAPTITMSPTSMFDAFVVSLAKNMTKRSAPSAQALQTRNSPQYKAIVWVADLIYNQGQSLSPDQLLQKFALASFYYATNGMEWTNHTGWLDPNLSECNWNGVRCLQDEATVIALDFRESNNFNGTLPYELALLSSLNLFSVFSAPGLGGTLDSGILNSDTLSALQTFRVEWCGITGKIPTTIRKLNTTLLNFIVTGNELTGTLPSELWRLTLLEILAVTENKLSGSLSANVGMLTSLKNLVLDSNSFTGSIPADMPPTLIDLSFIDNQFTGGFDFLQGLTSLTSFGGSRNVLVGPMPTFLGKLVGLRSLRLDGNQISGTIFTQFDRLSDLDHLELKDNRLTGSIPFDALTNLSHLSLANNLLQATLPQFHFPITNLKYLDLSLNQIQGVLPDSIGEWSLLEYFDVSNNQIQGSIPTEIGTLSRLCHLSIAGNALEGTIPTQIVNLFNFSALEVDKPVVLDMSSNALTGTIPSELTLLVGIEEIILEYNDLTGTLPQELRNETMLSVLRVGHNGLTGTLPTVYGLAMALKVLGLEHNRFQGSIPLDYYNLEPLHDFRTHGNFLTGTAPELFCVTTALGVVRDGTQFTVECPMECSCCKECETTFHEFPV